MAAPGPAQKGSDDIPVWDDIGYPLWKHFQSSNGDGQGLLFFYTDMNKEQQRACLQGFAQAYREGKVRQFWKDLNHKAAQSTRPIQETERVIALLREFDSSSSSSEDKQQEP